jgi:uncharacterized protein YutE (UPF0331/DUF86 family)
MVADAEVVRDREARIRRYLADLREMGTMAEAAFLEHRERQYAVLHALQLVIEASVDIATHIAAADDLGLPASYAEAFDLLERASIVDAALADALRRMARFRNRIVYFYGDLDLRVVHDVVRTRLGDFDQYLAAIERYLTRDTAD